MESVMASLKSSNDSLLLKLKQIKDESLVENKKMHASSQLGADFVKDIYKQL